MVCDASKGISLYIDGEKAGESLFAGKIVMPDTTPTIIGKTQVKMTPALTERKTSQAFKSWMYFDGLLDELEIRNTALTDKEIRKEFQAIKVANIQPLQFRKMPSGTDDPKPFGAYYAMLNRQLGC